MAIGNDNNPPGPQGSFGNGSYRGEYSGQSSPPKNAPGPNEVDLRQLFYTLWHYKWLIMGTVLIGILIAGVMAYNTTPIYRSEGALLITQQQNQYSSAGSDLASMLTNTYGIGTGSAIGNQLRIMRSRNMIAEIADTLIKKQLMENGNQYPVLFESYPEDSTLASRDQIIGRLEAGISYSKTSQDTDVISITYNSPAPQEASDIVNVAMEVYTIISTRQNRRSANSAVQFLANEKDRIEKQLKNVENDLRQYMKKTELVQIDQQTSQVINQMATLEAERQQAKIKLEAVQSGMDNYRERLNKIKPGLAEQYADAIGPNMQRLQYKLAELEMEKTQLLANNPSLKDAPELPEELKKINNKIEIYKNNVRDLTKNLIAEGDEYIGFLGGSGGNVTQAITDLNKQLVELQVQREQNLAQIEVIDEQMKELEGFLESLPENMMTLGRLKRDVKINEELYLTISQQYAEMSLWKQTQFGRGRIVERGIVPGSPIKPDTKIYLLVGFILGGVISVGYVFVREAFNIRIDGVEKLKRYGVPLMAVIPDMSAFIKDEYDNQEKVNVQGSEVSTTLVSMLDTVSPISESFRRLESNIVYSNPDMDLNSLMITSSTKGEGKTTVASNLGVVLAESGYKTVVVDADLRRPNLHNMFGSKRAPGIAEVLFDNVPIEEALQETPMSQLSIFTSGKRPPNPSSITKSDAFLQTIKDLEKTFDFVLIDTPPYGIITDASAVVQQTDGIVVVTKFNETTETELDHVMNSLQHIKANVLGTVLMAFDYNQTSDYYYSSHYYRELYEDYDSYSDEG
ncbi:GumC family protein [Fodinibius sp. AD559]|uniref:GumC family protein n=1 Tax=Fodinibius sp. AD559 TaxID=3424179 RepID=UPI004046DC38